MVAPGSHLIGHTLAGLRFAHVYHARVQGLHRHRLSIRQPLDQVPLAMGDVFLLDAPESALDLMRADPGLVLLAERPQQRSSIRRALLALGILTAVVAVAAAGWMSIVASAIFGCVALILLRVLEAEDAYAAIDWRGCCAGRRAAAGDRLQSRARRRWARFLDRRGRRLRPVARWR